MIGNTISHYRIVEKLGEGGMGIVYVAEDTVLGRRVAIKTLTIKPGQDEQHFRTRFLREARAVSALSHPHIATIHDYGETKEGEPYIVMELVKGQMLSDLMMDESLTIARAIEIIEQVAEALSEAHRNGVVHRDIKPSNVAINQRGEVKVLDFGLAKQLNLDSLTDSDPERQTLLTSQTQEGAIIGTPLYLSPEQALGMGGVDQRSDIFSLGTLLYECVSGRPPFDGTTRMEICTKVIRDDPTPPSQLNPNVPESLDRIALKALAKKPEARYQSADEMREDLYKLRSDMQVSSMDHAVTRLVPPAMGTRATGTLAALSDIFRRPRISVGYVIAGIAVLLLIGVVAWRLTRTTPYEPKPEARRLYELAQNALREGAFFKSSKILQQAIADDDRYALSHARLAEAWTELDFSEKAKDELIRAKDLVPNRSALAAIDAIRFQAITDTVKRDFPAAVESYRQLAEQVPAAERKFALVDLGRAYEKNEQLDKAIESYQKATEGEHYAAAFLRLGTALGRSQKYSEADSALEQAGKLFGMSNEIEGTTEVLFQRGILLGQQGKFAEARVQFNQALERSVALENNDQRIRTLQALSNTYVQTGDSPKALEYSQKAMDLARSSNMENLTTAGLIDIGNSYLINGNFAEAEKNYSEALRLAQNYKGRLNEARALLALGSLRKQQDDPQAARDYTQQALTFFQQGNYGKQMFQAYTNLGYAYVNLGDYAGAEKTFKQLLEAAQRVGDLRSIAFAHDGLGYVCNDTERFSEAVAHFTEEYRIGKSTNAPITVGYASNYRASAFWRMGDYENARVDLAEASAIAAPAGQEPYKDLLADATWSTAAMNLSQRNFSGAATTAQKALDLAGNEYKITAIRARAALGLATALSGQANAGRKRCDEAVQLARAMHNPHLLSEALLALAEATLAAGDAQAAVTAAGEAQVSFNAANQHESEWRAFAIQALASDKLGDKDKARQLAAKADSIRATLEQPWGSDNYKSYLARPDVVEWIRQLASLNR